jgi:hypothetical protein
MASMQENLNHRWITIWDWAEYHYGKAVGGLHIALRVGKGNRFRRQKHHCHSLPDVLNTHQATRICMEFLTYNVIWDSKVYAQNEVKNISVHIMIEIAILPHTS